MLIGTNLAPRLALARTLILTEYLTFRCAETNTYVFRKQKCVALSETMIPRNCINGPLEQFIAAAPASTSAIRGARSPQPMLAPQRHCCEKMATPENGSEFVYRRKISTCFIATDKI